MAVHLAPNAAGPRVIAAHALEFIRHWLAHWAAAVFRRLLGAADGQVTAALAYRELRLTLRSRQWQRFLLLWTCWSAALVCVPLLYRLSFGAWSSPSGLVWLTAWGYAMQLSAGVAMANWAIRQLRQDLEGPRLDELLLTRATPADIAMGRACGLACVSLWMAAASLPAGILLTALGGVSPAIALRLMLAIIPVGMLGVWFGLGWGLAFSLRRPGGRLRSLIGGSACH